MSLIASLGLDDVPADPNDVPDGKYDGAVVKSEFVLQENKDTLSHAITYKVTEGEYAGAQKQQWYTLYKSPRNAEGTFPTNATEVKAAQPGLSDAQKRWYKKLFVDLLAIPEEEVSKKNPEDLVGVQVTFGIKTNNGYKNISFVERRATEGSTPEGPVALNPF